MSLLYWFPLNGDLHNQGLSPATLTNSNATVNDNGKIGQCYSFVNGSGSKCYSHPLDTTFTTVSICGWAKIDSSATKSGYLFGLSVDGDANFMLHYNATNTLISVYANDSSRYIYQDATNYLDTWHHYTATYDGTKFYLYIDGTYIKASNAVTLTSLTGKRIYLGCKSDTSAGSGQVFYTGLLNDIRVYDHCLSPKEIEEIAKGLVLHYPLNSSYIGTKTNLLPLERSRPTSGWTTYGNNVSSSEYLTVSYTSSNGEYIMNASGNSSTAGSKYIYYKLTSDTLLSFGKSYVFSCYIRANDATHIGKQVYIQAWNNNSQLVARGVNYFTLTAEWQKISTPCVTFVDEDDYTGSTTINLLMCIGVAIASTATAIGFQTTKFMLEEGVKPTDWIPGGSTKTYSTIYDTSGYSRNGTIVGSLTAAAGSPRYDVATTFDGSTSQITAASVSSEVKTISVWVNFTTLASDQYAIIMLDYKSKLALCLDTYGIVCSTAGAGNSYRYSRASLTTNTWYHFVVINPEGNTSTTRQLYINGVPQTALTTKNSFSFTTDQLQIGKRASGSSSAYPFSGKISDVRLYATVLTDDQVKELYNTSMSIDSNGNVYARELVELI